MKINIELDVDRSNRLDFLKDFYRFFNESDTPMTFGRIEYGNITLSILDLRKMINMDKDLTQISFALNQV